MLLPWQLISTLVRATSECFFLVTLKYISDVACHDFHFNFLFIFLFPNSVNVTFHYINIKGSIWPFFLSSLLPISLPGVWRVCAWCWTHKPTAATVRRATVDRCVISRRRQRVGAGVCGVCTASVSGRRTETETAASAIRDTLERAATSVSLNETGKNKELWPIKLSGGHRQRNLISLDLHAFRYGVMVA